MILSYTLQELDKKPMGINFNQIAKTKLDQFANEWILEVCPYWVNDEFKGFIDKRQLKHALDLLVGYEFVTASKPVLNTRRTTHYNITNSGIDLLHRIANYYSYAYYMEGFEDAIKFPSFH